MGVRECVEDDDPQTPEVNEIGTVTCTAEMPFQPGELNEECDGFSIDEDCDGFVDEGFDLLNDLNNCGSCGNVCEGADAECIEVVCFRTYWVMQNSAPIQAAMGHPSHHGARFDMRLTRLTEKTQPRAFPQLVFTSPGAMLAETRIDSAHAMIVDRVSVVVQTKSVKLSLALELVVI